MPRSVSAQSGRAALVAVTAVGLAILAGAAALAWRNWTRAPYREAVRLLAADEPAAAVAALETGSERPGLEGAEAELLGICRLRLGRTASAQEALDAAARVGGAGELRPTPLEFHAERLLADGLEAGLGQLCDYAGRVLEPLPPELLAYRGIARHAQADLVGAREAYRAALDAGLSGALRSLVEAELGRAAEESRSGRVPVVQARGGEVLAWREAATGELVAGPELAALLGGAGVAALPQLREGDLDGRVELSLDIAFQRRAARVYSSEAGGFVALSVPGGEILAAVSEAKPEVPLAPFAGRFQPGSTLKVLTMAAWLDAGLADELVVPHRCRGNDFVIDGEILYDWAAHGELATLERALSQSCNTVFARMGLQLGERDLRQALRPLGFGASLEEGAEPDAGSGIPSPGGQPFGSGALAAGPLGEKRLARTAMGLDSTRVSPLQAAVIGLAFASGGEYRPPRLVRRRMNSVGAPLPLLEPESEPLRVFSVEAATRVARAMGGVVTDADGTGRGAASAGVPVALKTGTTGGDGAPLSSAFVGFFPARSPEIAFGMFTQDSGRSLDVSRRVLGPFLKDVWTARTAPARTN